MSIARYHADWLNLVENTGPFLSLPVLKDAFPQGLDEFPSPERRALREQYEIYCEHRQKNAVLSHQAWIRYVLTVLLGYPGDPDDPGQLLVEGQNIPQGMVAVKPRFHETLRPSFALKHPDKDKKPVLLISFYAQSVDLDKPLPGLGWKASPGTRMMELLHETGITTGLITNGEDWMLVFARPGEATGFASWSADMWMQEPSTLLAFRSLLHVRRFFGVAEDRTLPALLLASSQDQHEVTDQLGYQVRQAVEVLVASIDSLGTEGERNLIAEVDDATLYSAALTVMMRLVFLFAAEERGMLLLGQNEIYDTYYALSTLRDQLRSQADQHVEEVLERRSDAWCRLLAAFRAIHGGVEHANMRMPAFGGSLFDPDRYPFLEGRAPGTTWRTAQARPLSINNRVVLHLLDALQLLRVKLPGGGPAETRRLSFHSLDIEQIGHVYEGLLDHTVKRASETILGLSGGKNTEPEILLARLEELAAKTSSDFGGKVYAVDSELVQFLKEETGRNEKTIAKALNTPSPGLEGQLKILCNHDTILYERIRPFVGLVRRDSFDQLVVIREGSRFVTSGNDRRSSGTHYTPRSLTEPIVQHTLEPLVYVGPAEGKPESEWQLKSPKEILDLRVCDMAMGSAAFLVQVCRYLSERLVEAWEILEQKQSEDVFLVTPEGKVSAGGHEERLLPADPGERLAIARRIITDRCLYGVDINPMAVEMAKLSMWLITMQKDRPFTFLDHAFKCGDSLLGVTSVRQIENFSLRPDERQITFATANLARYVEESSTKRRALEAMPSNDHTQIEAKRRLHAEAESAMAKVKAVADCLVAFELRGIEGKAYEEQRIAEAEKVQLLMKSDTDTSLNAQPPATNHLSAHAREQLRGRRPFHWAVEFPEVLGRGGFDAIVGNPPFVKGHFISRFLGDDVRKLISYTIAGTSTGLADYSTFFLVRGVSLANEQGHTGLIVTNSVRDGDSRAVGIELPKSRGAIVRYALPDMPWPGTADVTVCFVILTNVAWSGILTVSGKVVTQISSQLTAEDDFKPYPIKVNSGQCFIGSYLLGDGFIVKNGEQFSGEENDVSDVVLLYMNGQEFFSLPEPSPVRKVICFWDWSLEEAQKKYPALTEHLRLTVKLTREGVNRDRRRELWWLYAENTPGLYHATGLGSFFKNHPKGWTTSKNSIQHVIAKAKSSDTWAFEFLPARMIFDQTLAVFATDKFSYFATLQSEHHWVWAGKLVSGNKGEEARKKGGAPISYTPSTVFETFPFPVQGAELEVIGSRYHGFRHQIMLVRNEGLTKTYNRFHDPVEQSTDIAKLRELHVEMDKAVAVAYGWSDLDLGHGFHETKQGIRYTISESARHIVLDNLLKLNHERYAEEVKAGLHDKKKIASGKQRGKTSAITAPDKLEYSAPDLFSSGEE